jgi:hypothetical protein
MKRVCVFTLLGFAFVCLALTGCSGGGGAAVTGSVTLDGQPVSDAEVSFEAFDRTQTLGADVVRTDSSGKFEVKPHPKKKGLTPGKYAVYVSKWVNKQGTSPKPEDMEMEKAAGVLRNVLPFKYSNREAGPEVTVEIKAGKNELPPFALSSK